MGAFGGSEKYWRADFRLLSDVQFFFAYHLSAFSSYPNHLLFLVVFI